MNRLRARNPQRPRRIRHYPAVRSHDPVEPTGTGDAMIAALAAARIEPRLVGGRIAAGFDLLLAAVRGEPADGPVDSRTRRLTGSGWSGARWLGADREVTGACGTLAGSDLSP